jgi:hypothetical protein
MGISILALYDQNAHCHLRFGSSGYLDRRQLLVAPPAGSLVAARLGYLR